VNIEGFTDITQVIESIPLPSWAQWLAMDEDGSLWAYQAEPHCFDHGWYENEVGDSQRLTTLQCSLPWRDCLWHIDSIKGSPV